MATSSDNPLQPPAPTPSSDPSAPEINETSLWRKITRHGKTAGREVVLKALQLFYALRSPDTPKWAKGVIVSALIYFISPIDAIPDWIPGVGYIDDLSVLTSALLTVASSITPEIKTKAEQRMKQWFGE
jgi:uncharacterized membrane protein YkvA (DUF1232 family)